MLKIILREKRLEKLKAFKLNIDERLYKKAKINVKENFFYHLFQKSWRNLCIIKPEFFLTKIKFYININQGFVNHFYKLLLNISNRQNK